MRHDPALEYLNRRASLAVRSQLRPQTSSEIIDSTARTFQAIGATILRQTAWPAMIGLTTVAFFSEFVLPGLLETRDPTSLRIQSLEVLFVFAVGALVALPLFLFGLSATTTIVTRIVADHLSGNRIDESAARKLGSVYPRLVLLTWRTTLSASSGFVVGMALLFIAAYLSMISPESELLAALAAILAIVSFCGGGLLFLYMVARHALAPSSLVIEQSTPGISISRSIQLLARAENHDSGYGTVWGATFVCGFILLLAYFGAAAGLNLLGLENLLKSLLGHSPLRSVVLGILDLLPAYAALWLTVPFWCACMTTLYFDRRIRLEGLDIELLAHEAQRSTRLGRFQL